MKLIRVVSFFATILLSTHIFCQTPADVKGIWANNDRIVFFGNDDDFSVILKLYYGWCYDRTSENETFDALPHRNVNNATSLAPIRLSVKYRQLKENTKAWELEIFEDGKIIDSIPFCIIGDNIYLNFLIRNSETNTNSDQSDLMNETQSAKGFWEGVNSRQTIKTCKGITQNEIICWYVEDDCAYRLRFWKTNMDFDKEAMAAFTDGDKVYSINKHINSALSTFTCSNGRSSRIRNVEKYQELPFEITFDENKNIAAIGKPSFTKANKKNTPEEVAAIVNEANSRMCPIPPSPFPVPDFDFEKHHYVKSEKQMTKTDFHWDLIDDMEKGIEIIQDVRKRQKDFGPRGKDSGN